MSRKHKYFDENCSESSSSHMPKKVQYPVGMGPVSPVANQRLAEATVVYQVYAQIWEPQTGLKAGTIFPELYRPYEINK